MSEENAGGQEGGQETAPPVDGGQQAPAEGGQQQAPAGGSQPKSFSEQVQDSELREWAEAKGWKDVDGVLKSARNLEKMVGAPPEELVRVPQDAGEEQVRQVLQRLGLPDEPSGYEIPESEKLPADENFMNWARDAFHEAGLTKQQAQMVASKWNEYAEGTVQKQQDDYQATVEADEQALRKEWGNGYDRQTRLAKLAAKQLEVGDEQLDAMEQAMGYAGVMKFFANLGNKMGEDNFVGDGGEGGDRGFSNQMTPAQAKEAYARMISDDDTKKALTDKMHPNHKQVLEKKQRLFAIIYPEQG